MPVAVQYSTEKYSDSDGETNPINIVLVSMLLLDDDTECEDIIRPMDKCVVLTDKGSKYANDVQRFKEKPLKSDAVLVQIGRVLNSSLNSPTAYMALNSSVSKVLYDSLSPIEIELGCN